MAAGRDPYRVLFVCTGNICRSAYAEVVARHMAPEGVEFSSAGTYALVGHGLDAPMAREAAARGADTSHKARQLARGMVEDADLVIVMAAEHRRYILDDWPALGRRTFIIGQVARELGRLPGDVGRGGITDHLWRNRTSEAGDDVPDPYRRGQSAAASAAAAIDGYLEVICGVLAGLGRASGG